MLIAVRSDEAGQVLVTILYPGAPLRWHLWIAEHVLRLPHVARVSFCPVPGSARRGLGARAFRRLRPEAIPGCFPPDVRERVRLLADERAAQGLAGAELWEYRIGSCDGDPAGVRELARGEAAFTIALRRRDDPPTAALHLGSYPIRYTLPRTLDRALADAASWPAKLLRLRAMGAEPAPLPDPRPAAEDRAPRRAGWSDYAGLASSTSRRLLRIALEKLFVDVRWNVGVVDAPLGLDPPFSQVKWLQPAAGYFLADPMIGERDGGAAVLCEYYPFATGKGEIALVRPGVDGAEPQPVITHPRHLSYPFLVEHAGRTYCLPENAQSGELTIYEAVRFPDEWRRLGTILDDVPAVDPTVLRHDERWWLLATRADRDANVNLFAWFADDLLGPWHEHPANPIKTDVTGARPAGNVFRLDGALYRPAQDCSQRYGGAVTLHRIVELTPQRFREVLVRRFEPIPPYCHGLHTLSSAGGRFVIDGRTDFIDLRKPIARLRRMVR